jgi:hypothetical protein
MSKHTPGPWKIVPSWHDWIVEGPNGEEIIWQDGNYNTPTISIEDARLIAAAPDLLEALKEVYDWCYPTDSAWAIKARAAIAKATGANNEMQLL